MTTVTGPLTTISRNKSVVDVEPSSSRVFAFDQLTEPQAVQIVSSADTQKPARYWEFIDGPRERLLVSELEKSVLDDIIILLGSSAVREELGDYDAELLRDWLRDAAGGLA